MSSLRRIVSSRANGARSKGPVTAEGKRRSSQNAITHGLLARRAVLPDENQQDFQDDLNHHLQRLHPAGAVETGLVEQMVSSSRRLRRAWAMETRMFEDQSAAQTSGDDLDRLAAVFSDLAGQFSLIQRYQTRLHLRYQRSLRDILLRRLTAAPNEPSPISEHSPAPGPPLPPPPIEAPPGPGSSSSAARPHNPPRRPRQPPARAL